MMSLRTPLSRARGLGSAKEGVSHWWAQRVTAIANIPLVLWFIVFVIQAVGTDYETATALIARPLNAILLILLLLGTPFVLSIIATLYPAWRASRTDPAAALAYE